MAILLIEEVLVGFEEVRAALEQALATVEVLVDGLHPDLGEDLRATLEQAMLQPLRDRLTALEHLQAPVEMRAA